jgi:hypothetical protein
MIIQIVVEDTMQEIYDSPGAKQQVEAAVLRKLFELRDAYHARQSHQTFSRGFIGTAKDQK